MTLQCSWTILVALNFNPKCDLIVCVWACMCVWMIQNVVWLFQIFQQSCPRFISVVMVKYPRRRQFRRERLYLVYEPRLLPTLGRKGKSRQECGAAHCIHSQKQERMQHIFPSLHLIQTLGMVPFTVAWVFPDQTRIIPASMPSGQTDRNKPSLELPSQEGYF